MRDGGVGYAVLDAVTDADLDTLAAVLDDMAFITGGSGLGGALARRITARLGRPAGPASRQAIPPGKTTILSGSCSEMTNKQVAAYLETAESKKVDVARCLENSNAYAAELAVWADIQTGSGPAPLVYATAGKGELAAVQRRFGSEAASRAVEELFVRLTVRLAELGVTRFIVAGGETSGFVSEALPAKAFRLGLEIAPGVPWIRSLDQPYCQALKSGNFGDERFFSKAQECMGE